jgi:hypothetical protein
VARLVAKEGGENLWERTLRGSNRLNMGEPVPDLEVTRSISRRVSVAYWGRCWAGCWLVRVAEAKASEARSARKGRKETRGERTRVGEEREKKERERERQKVEKELRERRRGRGREKLRDVWFHMVRKTGERRQGQGAF